MSHFQVVDDTLFFSRGDRNDPRLGELVRPQWPSSGKNTILSGYPDDEGVKLNGGRIGASQGPDHIRKYLYKMTPPAFNAHSFQFNLHDHGNIVTNIPLQERHEAAKKNAFKVLQAGHRHLSFGGGHDYGYPDGAGFLQNASASAKPLVINFDAHLDVRPTDRGLSSGTPFYRLLSEFENFDLLQIGVQKHCNSRGHEDWCRSKGGHILSWDEVLYSGEASEIVMLRFVEPFIKKHRACFLSVDIDAFSSAYAPGCSQAWATGLHPEPFFKLLAVLLARLDVQALGLYEVAPRLDHDDRTAKLAAQIAYEFLIFGAHQ